MYDLPDPVSPPKSPATKFLLVVGVIICLAAAAGIAVLGVDLAAGGDPLASGEGASGDTSDTSDASVVSSRPAGPHKVISGPCEPLESVSTSPKLSRLDVGAPRDSTAYSPARCDGVSKKGEVRANVDYRVYFDTASLKGVEPAREHYNSAVSVYGKKDQFEKVSGIGDDAFVVPLTDDVWQLELVDANLTMTVTADGGPDRDADVALAKQVAEAYIEATK